MCLIKKFFIFFFILILSSMKFTSVRADTSLINLNEIKLLTLNTWMIPVLRKMAKARAEAIGRQIGRFDVALMQEVFTPGIRSTLATLAHESDHTNRYQTTPCFKLNSGVFTLTKYQVTKTDFLRFYHCLGFQCLSGKGVLYVQIKLPTGQLVDLFNTHMQPNQKDYRIRKRQIQRTLKFINQKNDGTNPVIFAGDFNIIGETPEYNTLTRQLTHFRDAWKEFRPDEDGFTWDPSVNYWADYDYSESQFLQRLDYIFIRDGRHTKIKIKDISLAFNTEKIWYGVFKQPSQIFVSDHFGVEATLSVLQM